MEKSKRGTEAKSSRESPQTGSSTASMPPRPMAVREPLPPLPTLTILAHPNLDRVGDRVLLGELLACREVQLCRRRPRFKAPGAHAGEPLGDRFLSRRPFHLQPGADGGILIHRGASPAELRLDGEILRQERHVSPQALDDGVVLELARRVVLLLHRHPADCDEPDSSFGMVGASAGLAEVRASIARLAAFDVPVLIRGETGTGKELVARALHEHGSRRDGPFLDVSLAALPPSLATAELFGAAKGAYTGATRDRRGHFEQAHGGTLFLDEVGEAPAGLQVLLLRALETGKILPAGAAAPRRVDVRLLSATDEDLEAACLEGRFRAPLLYRLAGYILRIPPLRHRRDDIGRLLVHFLRQGLEEAGAPVPETAGSPTSWLPPGLVSRLARAAWPGNIRQLRHLAHRLIIDGRDKPQLGLGMDLREWLGEPSGPAVPELRPSPPPAPQPPSGAAAPRRRKPSQIPEDELLEALRSHRFNLTEAASALGVPRTSLYARIERSDRLRVAAEIPPEAIREAWRRFPGDLAAMVSELEISERALRQRLRDMGLR